MRQHLAALCAVMSCACFSVCPPPAVGAHARPVATASFTMPESAVTPDGAMPLLPPLTVGAPFGAKSINTEGLRLIEGFEGYSRCAYWDSSGGVYTVGYGQTRLPNGTRVYATFCFASQAAAEANLRVSVIREYQWAVTALGPKVYTSQHAVNGLDSFAYNLGAGIFTGSLRVYLERGDFTAACSIMLQYDHAGGLVLPGLARRRAQECAEIRKPEPRPASRKELEARRRTLRRVLLADGCDARRDRHLPLGPRCRRWFAEGAQVNRELR